MFTEALYYQTGTFEQRLMSDVFSGCWKGLVCGS